MPVPKLNECNGLIFTARTQEVRLFSQIRPKVQQLIIYTYLKHVHDEYVENV